MTDFYLTLPSSVKNPQFENTSSRYVTHLPEVLHLERDKYVVAATVVIYPYSFVNVGRPLSYWIHMKNGPPLHVTFPAAQYSALDQIIDSLNYEPPRRRKNRLKRRAPLNPEDIEIFSTMEWSKSHKRAKTDSEREERMKQEAIEENIAAFQAAQDAEEQEAKKIQSEIDENRDAERIAREEEREEKMRREEIAKIKAEQGVAEQDEAEFEKEEKERDAAYIAENTNAFQQVALMRVVYVPKTKPMN